MTIRPATRADCPGILAIYNDAVLTTTATYDYEPRTLEQREGWFDDHARDGYAVFVAEGEGGRIVGWSALNPYHARPGYRFTSENSIYIAADMRGQGLGKLLLAPLIEAAQRIQVQVNRCLYVGDDLRDVQAGKAAGMRTAAAAWGWGRNHRVGRR